MALVSVSLLAVAVCVLVIMSTSGNGPEERLSEFELASTRTGLVDMAAADRVLDATPRGGAQEAQAAGSHAALTSSGRHTSLVFQDPPPVALQSFVCSI